MKTGDLVHFWDTGLCKPKIGLIVNIQVAGGEPFIYLCVILSQSGEIVHLTESDVRVIYENQQM